MATYSIRKFKDRDHEAVRTMFAEGMLEHIPASHRFLLMCPQVHMFFLAVFLVIFIVFQSYLISAIVIVVVFVVGRLYLDFQFQSYVKQSLSEDLLDIQKSYMQKEGACFWVAVSGSEVVGMVAAQPFQTSDGEAKVELKRMSVGRKCRGQGIGKGLCRAVIGFARERGCKAVVLHTSVVQYDAHKLYERVGFYKLPNPMFFSFLARVINFGILCYTCDLPPSS
ncbi:probable N-acetyltransferase family 8 member 5 [Ambystoma mexicanum]|uniref:probable N-acetyltransferase family 8 member 5 n=1 Tax=Ambystoma mexicanum TaxID=8296 RepID=UPI0037E7A770